MFYRTSIAAVALTAALMAAVCGAAAFDETKYPDWSGQWKRPSGLATQWDQGKPAGLGQQAPLTPEYQARLVASIADQAEGGQGLDTRYKCLTNGMPRVMAAIFPARVRDPAQPHLRQFRGLHAAPHLHRRTRLSQG